jgi:hypothetical protein
MEKIKNNKQKREDDTKQVEKSSCQKFLKLYNKQLGKNIKFIKFGNPDLGKGEPDCICSDGLNIEVATAYYDNLDAKGTWGLIDFLKNRISKENYEKKYPDNTLGMKSPDQGLYDSINKIVTNKNKKEYEYVGKLFLLIPSRPAITDQKDIEVYIKHYRNFENLNFDEVWFLLYNDCYPIFQLAKRGDKFLSKNNGKIKFERIIK